jgi:DNA-directed RNA polymerase subunit L
MRITVVKSEENYLEVIVHDETHTLFSPLLDYLLRHPDVEYAMYNVDHPLTRNTRLKLRTRGRRPMDVMGEAVSRLIKDLDEIERGLVG